MSFKVGDKLLGLDERCFIIAEAGSNHGGDLTQAKELVDIAVDAQVDCIKFQSYEGASLFPETHPSHKTLDRYRMLEEWHSELHKYCMDRGIIFSSTAFDYKRLQWLSDIGVPFYKVASGDITYLDFIKEIAYKGKPIFLSTGMSTLGEVEEAVDTILSTGNDQIVLLHCVGRYPAKEEEVNLKALETLRHAFGLPVGFSDHTVSTVIPALAVCYGATVIEKHFTLDRNLETPDHPFALRPDQLREMVMNIRTAEAARGNGRKIPTESEKSTSRINARRAIYASTWVKRGEILTKEKLKVVRPGKGLAPKYLDSVIGKRAAKELRPDEPLDFGSVLWE